MSDTKPLSMSWTALRIHEECRHKGMLKRSGVRSPMQDVRNYFHGTVADKIVREWLEDPERQLGTMQARVAPMFDSEAEKLANSDQGYVRWKNLADKATMQAKVEQLVVTIEPWLVTNVLPHEFEPEVRFRFPISMPGLRGEDVVVMLVGGIDILVRTAEGDWHVWDLKATANPDYWRSSKGQLVFYGLALQMGFAPHKVPTKVGLVQPLVPEFEKVLELTDEDYSLMWSRMVRMLHDIQRGDFAYREGVISGCNWCEVRSACSRFKPVKAFVREPRETEDDGFSEYD